MSSHDSQNSTELDLAKIAGRASEDVKLAHRAAVLLQQEIISGHLEGGHSLGTAAEIRARYNLGRWAFREATGILEVRGVARLRPGPGGGVIVVEPDINDLVSLTLLYFYLSGSGHREILDARRAVLVSTVKKLLQDPPASNPLKFTPVFGDRAGFPRFLASRTGNGALELAVEFVESVWEACVPAAALPDDVQRHLQESLWTSICTGNDAAALEALDVYLAEAERITVDVALGLPHVFERQAATGKLAYKLALQILRDIVERPEPSNNSLGSESEMGVRFDANAEIIRQAVRLIEDLGVVAPRRGRKGGVILRAPDTAAIVALIPHLLSKEALPVASCFDVAGFLGVEIAGLAAARSRRLSTPGNERSAPPGASDLWSMIAVDRQIQDYADSPLLATIERGLLLYSCTIESPDRGGTVPGEKIAAMSDDILHAVEQGDIDGATTAAHERFKFMSLRFTAPHKFFEACQRPVQSADASA